MLFVCANCNYATMSEVKYQNHNRRKSPCAAPSARKEREYEIAYIMTIVRNKVRNYFKDNQEDKKLTFTEPDYNLIISKCCLKGVNEEEYFEDFLIHFEGVIRGKHRMYNFYAEWNTEGILKNRI
jgi:hypothetical protein